ncbi:TlpA family protein disulfide reductase [Flavobacterium dankookense]|jgi:thiol-disulfide isomerase/thioredoxin|uniref:Thiol-disulfide isomerase/thioredoxin n=1 Tax=Flavobacterium dankookense TaxID=706186 RepID=A0A4R6Q9L9_9FLAO|nr:TlpA disulfide reductase family protein [Flavobacterium dankookense]TDP59324.1 thiol-disulfide isomerase/thioredoxin [Flavobacterium dankookense]
MNKIYLVAVLFLTFSAFSQSKLPNVTVKDLDNNPINVSTDFTEQDKIYVFSFWATWCVPCINELEAINDVYADWKKELNLELIAVSIDDSRTQKRVKPLLNGKGWEYKMLLDGNQDFKRALSIANIPYTIIVKNQKIVHIQNGYSQGAEKELFSVLKTL